MIFRSLFISMVTYAAFVCVVLALIRREDTRLRVRYAVSLFLIMVVGALLFGWFMYLFMR